MDGSAVCHIFDGAQNTIFSALYLLLIGRAPAFHKARIGRVCRFSRHQSPRSGNPFLKPAALFHFLLTRLVHDVLEMVSYSIPSNTLLP